MPETLYDTLGISHQATQAEIRAAYRKLVLQHHPDQAGKASVEAFLEVKKAYEVLIDSSRRQEYDRILEYRSRPKIPTRNPQQHQGQARSQARPEARPRDPVASVRTQVAEDLSRLIRLYGKGAYAEADRVARQIVQKDPRQPTPYAILGDLARAKGELTDAAKMYAFAAQLDPRNPIYQRKHEELISRLNPQARNGYEVRRPSGMSAFVSFGLVVVAGAYTSLANEPPVFGRDSWLSTWTFGLIVMLFLSGVCVGAGLSAGNFLDRFESVSANSMNRVSPALALASIAIVNYWAANLLYVLIGLRERSFSYSVTRLFAGVGVALMIMVGAAVMSDRIDPFQVLIWGGNLIYVGAVCGWMVADTARD